ncbi:hypothetical protein J4476_03715 [Candidatus Woesearchaeota archaeon]|nr:hypothetical protein [Candidatus Woesearchaeota archaeon]HIH25340.1 hypothetical protein [Nanoarchaeota archaeon]
MNKSENLIGLLKNYKGISFNDNGIINVSQNNVPATDETPEYVNTLFRMVEVAPIDATISQDRLIEILDNICNNVIPDFRTDPYIANSLFNFGRLHYVDLIGKQEEKTRVELYKDTPATIKKYLPDHERTTERLLGLNTKVILYPSARLLGIKEIFMELKSMRKVVERGLLDRLKAA